MIEKLDFSKVKNSHIKPLDFNVINKAVVGDSDSIKMIIEHYMPYLKACAVSPTINEEWIKDKLADTVATRMYDENTIRERVKQIIVYQSYLTVQSKQHEEWILCF